MPPYGLQELFSQGLWSLKKGILPPKNKENLFPKTRLGRAIVSESPHTYTIRQKTPERTHISSLLKYKGLGMPFRKIVL